MPPDSKPVVVIGGGVIGVCSAYYLASAGVPVVLLEKNEICSGSSYGNCGLVALSHAAPLAAPGAVRMGLKWMFNPESPFHIAPRLDLQMIGWLLQFASFCTEENVEKGAPVLTRLLAASAALFDGIAATRAIDFGYEHRGVLSLFATEQGFHAAREEAKFLETVGVEAHVLSSAEARDREPAVRSSVVGGLVVPGDRHMIPDRFVHGLAQCAKEKGAVIREHVNVESFGIENRKITHLKTNSGNVEASTVVLAAGAWTRQLAKLTGLHVPVEAGKGYSVDIPAAGTKFKSPVMLAEARVLLTPMGDRIRIGGTIDFCGLNLTLDQRRANAVLKSVPKYLEEPEVKAGNAAWCGLRPCSPDGLPILGRSERIQNLILATGHAMLGVSLGPISGKLVAQLVAGQTPEIDVAPLSPSRFQ
jgi:D-amino-acid dehydrogenase